MAHESSTRTRLRLRPSEHRTLLVIGDLLMASIAVVGAIYTWRNYAIYSLKAEGVDPNLIPEILGFRVPFWFYLLPIAWVLLMIELYDPHTAASRRRTLRGVALAAIVGGLFYSLLFIIRTDPNSLPRSGVGLFLVYSALLTLLWRLIFIRLYTAPLLMRRMLIVGAGRSGQTLLQVYKKLKPAPFRLIGFIDDNPQKIHSLFDGYRVLCGSDRLLEVIEEQNISDLVIAISGEMRGATFKTLLDAQERGVTITRMPQMYEELVGRVPVLHLESDWVIRSFVDDLHIDGFYELGKRLLDIIGGLVGVIAYALLFPVVAAAIVIESGFPILYSQKRLGRGGREFTIYKFRTMRQDAESDGVARFSEANDPRVTRIGNFLRRTRLDEFPQFVNVLNGEMSLVGPRAERPEWVAHFERRIPFYRARLLAKPGLTGWAQVNFGYVATDEDTVVKLEYDLYYIKHRSFMMDVVIVLRTVGTMLRLMGR
jgi:exopolysaccharide biosynthesis polyprenyl glycosylphosphotransferase